MSNPSKAKGTAAETAVVNFFRRWWPHVERRALAGNADKGDLTGIPGWTAEVKACKRIELAAWVDELEAEIANAGADTGVLIIKRRGTTDVGRWYAVLPVARYVTLLKETDR